MEPTTAADWMAVADERLADAEAILKERPDSARVVERGKKIKEINLLAN